MDRTSSLSFDHGWLDGLNHIGCRVLGASPCIRDLAFSVCVPGFGWVGLVLNQRRKNDSIKEKPAPVSVSVCMCACRSLKGPETSTESGEMEKGGGPSYVWQPELQFLLQPPKNPSVLEHSNSKTLYSPTLTTTSPHRIRGMHAGSPYDSSSSFGFGPSWRTCTTLPADELSQH